MSGEKHGRGEEQAWQMLDTFASLGVRGFDLTVTDLDGHKRSFHPGQRGEPWRRRIPELLEWAIHHQHNLIVRPRGAPAKLIQLDDLSGTVLERVRRGAFLMLRTSLGNHQAWLAVWEGGPDWARRLRQGSGADPSASGATRLAGSVNFKRRYAPDFPVVEILEATPRRIVTWGELEALGVAAAPDGGGQWRPAVFPEAGEPNNGPVTSVVCKMPRRRTTAIGRTSAAPISPSACWRWTGVGTWPRRARVCWRKAARRARMGSVMPGSRCNAPPPRFIAGACNDLRRHGKNNGRCASLDPQKCQRCCRSKVSAMFPAG
jgi:hypothetical protein